MKILSRFKSTKLSAALALAATAMGATFAMAQEGDTEPPDDVVSFDVATDPMAQAMADNAVAKLLVTARTAGAAEPFALDETEFAPSPEDVVEASFGDSLASFNTRQMQPPTVTPAPIDPQVVTPPAPASPIVVTAEPAPPPAQPTTAPVPPSPAGVVGPLPVCGRVIRGTPGNDVITLLLGPSHGVFVERNGSFLCHVDAPVSGQGIVVDLGDGNDIFRAGEDFDIALEIDGGNGDDEIHGGSAGDVIRGGAGMDALYGHGGDDRINGNTQADKLFGGLGADVLIGGEAIDECRGEGGSDTFEDCEKKYQD